MNSRAFKELLRREPTVLNVVMCLIIGVVLFIVWLFFGFLYLTIAIVIVALFFIYTAVTSGKVAKNVVNIAHGSWRSSFETLLSKGYDGALMMVEAPSGKRPRQFANLTWLSELPAKTKFVQFTKYITENGVTLQLHFACAPWSASYYPALQDLLRQRGCYFDIYVVQDDDKFYPDIKEFIAVNLGQDVEQAISLTKLILLELFTLTPSDNASVWYANLSPYNKVGF